MPFARYSSFTPAHRAGSGTPLVCLHGFMDTWRTWDLVLPTLESRHDVLALTLPGHAGGPPLTGAASADSLVDTIERAMDAAGMNTAHLVGSSLGGYLALRLASRGRSRTVVALAPAGGWARDDYSYRELLGNQRTLYRWMKRAAPQADTLLSTRAGRRRATELLSVNFEHIPVELLAHQLLGAAGCGSAEALIDHAMQDSWDLDAEQLTGPVRIVWGTEDRLLPWPAAASRFRNDRLPHADWVLMEGVGHYPQLDSPLETSQLILGFTAD